MDDEQRMFGCFDSVSEQVDDRDVELAIGKRMPVEEVAAGGRGRVGSDVRDSDVATLDAPALSRVELRRPLGLIGLHVLDVFLRWLPETRSW